MSGQVEDYDALSPMPPVGHDVTPTNANGDGNDNDANGDGNDDDANGDGNNYDVNGDDINANGDGNNDRVDSGSLRSFPSTVQLPEVPGREISYDTLLRTMTEMGRELASLRRQQRQWLDSQYSPGRQQDSPGLQQDSPPRQVLFATPVPSFPFPAAPAFAPTAAAAATTTTTTAAAAAGGLTTTRRTAPSTAATTTWFVRMGSCQTEYGVASSLPIIATAHRARHSRPQP